MLTTNSAVRPLGLLCLIFVACLPAIKAENHHASPKLTGPAQIADDSVLDALDAALDKITNIYTQAVLNGTHTPELDISLRGLEMELYDLLDRLYKRHRLKDYMKYEALVTKQMLIYNLLKQLFGYAQLATPTR